jgi:hypothetical protein
MEKFGTKLIEGKNVWARAHLHTLSRKASKSLRPRQPIYEVRSLHSLIHFPLVPKLSTRKLLCSFLKPLFVEVTRNNDCTRRGPSTSSSELSKYLSRKSPGKLT